MVMDEYDIGDIQPLPNLDYKIMQGNSLLEKNSTAFASSMKTFSVMEKQTNRTNALQRLTNY